MKTSRQLLINREVNIEGNWYAPREHLQNFASVIHTEIVDSTSSAGDWGGYFCQKIGKKCYFIDFGQENNYPHSGYTLRTGEVLYTHSGELTQQEFKMLITKIQNAH